MLAGVGAVVLAVALGTATAGAVDFANPNTIDIPAGQPATTSGIANPYPSVVNVSGTSGVVLDVNVILHGLSHTWPDDIDVLLVAPDLTSAVIMSDAGGATDALNLTITLDDQAAAPLPNSDALASGSYRPANHGNTDDTFPAPAPTPGPVSTLATFDGTRANGVWQLYVVDDEDLDTGQFGGGWTLQLEVGPPGYYVASQGGELFNFGSADPFVNATGPVVDIVGTATGEGLYILGPNGALQFRGDAVNHGTYAANQVDPGEQARAIAVTPTGGGYWIFTDRGRVFAFGDAQSFGGMESVALDGPIIDAAPTPSGLGYWFIGSDGGVFSFGDAVFYGSMGGIPLDGPVVGIVPDPDGVGYWLFADDGGVFSFSADFRGSMGGIPLDQPMIGGVSYGNGYLLVARDGGVFVFSNLPFSGSLGGTGRTDLVAIAAVF